jgi:transposase-like protein
MEEPSTGLVESQPSDWHETLECAIRERVRELVECILEEELEEALGAQRSQRSAQRHGYRNGSKARRLTLRSGSVALRVPRARLVKDDGGGREWQSQLVPRYRRSTPEVEQALVGVYLSGGNTRRIRQALAPLLSGAPLSKSSVSRLVGRLEEAYQRWQQRDLGEEKIAFLYLDAIYPLLRSASRVLKLPILVALGIREDGEKVLLAMTSGASESTEAWALLVENLVARHLSLPQLIIGDGNKGLRAACDRAWPGAAHQRCTVHKLRNLEAKAPAHCREEMKEDYHRIVYAEDGAAAERERERFLAKWRKRCAPVAASLEEAGEELLTFFRFPASLHPTLRTTNVIERINVEFRRRVKTQGALPSESAVLRLFFALVASGQLRLRRIKGFREIRRTEQKAA